jgi:hypothetical protein
MKLEQYFELDENDLREIVLDLLEKKGLKPKDDITVSINTNENSVDGPVSIGRSWGFLKNGINISCEVESNIMNETKISA